MTDRTSPIGTFTKDPEAFLDFEFDWTDWLIGADVVVTSSWAIVDIDGTVPAVMEISNTIPYAPSTTGLLTKCWLVSGTAGHRYRLTNTIETDEGRIDERSAVIRCSDR